MKPSIPTSQIRHGSSSQRTARRRTALAIAAAIVGVAVVATLERDATRGSAPEEAAAGQEDPPARVPMDQSRAARPALPAPALPAEPALPVESAQARRRLPVALARQLTENKVQKYVHEAYPAWLRAHPGQQCPQQLSELNPYMDEQDTKDAWGRPLRMFCSATRPAGVKRIKVFSIGRDAERGTEDDIMAEE